MLPSLLPSYSLDYLGRQLLNQTFIYVSLSFRPNLPRFTQRVYNSSGVSCTLRRLSSTLPDPVPRLPSLVSDLQHDATVSLGRRVLRLRLLVIRSRSPPSRIFRPTFITTSRVPGLSLPPTVVSILVLVLSPVPAPVPAPIPTVVLIPILVFSPVLAPVSVPVTVSFLPSLVPCFPLGTISTSWRRVLRVKLLATCRCHLLSTDMMPRVEWQCLVFYFAYFLMCRIPELSSPPSPSLFSFPFLSAIPSPSPSPLLLSFPSPLSSAFPSCVRPRVSTPVSAPSPLPSPFPSCVCSLASTPVHAPDPDPDPVPVSVPVAHSDPAPDGSLQSGPSDLITLSVQCVCINTACYERSCRVPASTPCQQR